MTGRGVATIFGLVVDSGITRSRPSSAQAPPARNVPLPAFPPPTEPPLFATALRGYDRSQVDEHLAVVRNEAMALRHQLAESENRRVRAEHHAAATEHELRSVRDQQRSSDVGGSDSFGVRAEKIMRLADQEASDTRAAAARDSAALLEEARAEAEKHRHEVEQMLINRSSLLDQQSAQRTAELVDRENQLSVQFGAARKEAEATHVAARRAADDHRRKAEADADAVRRRAEQDVSRLRELAEHEVARLGALQTGARTELTRLVHLIETEVGSRSAQPPSAEATAQRPADVEVDDTVPAAEAPATAPR